jgi:hypothetical protein
MKDRRMRFSRALGLQGVVIGWRLACQLPADLFDVKGMWQIRIAAGAQFRRHPIDHFGSADDASLFGFWGYWHAVRYDHGGSSSGAVKED